MTTTPTTHPTRIAFVVQRFGADIIGGAETHARQLIAHFRSDLGWDVEVFTTTARDYTTWANAYPSGTEVDDGLLIHRFPVKSGRSKLFSLYNHATAPLIKLLRFSRLCAPLSRILESLWIYLQGPVCPDLVEVLKVRKNEFRSIIAMTYLYYPTLAVLRALGPQCILIPTAHDEHPFYFRSVQELIAGAKALAPNTPHEAALIHKALRAQCPPMEVAGIGFDQPGSPASDRPEEQPYLLYLGRVSCGKHADKLIAWFMDGLSSGAFPSETSLILIGQREENVTIPDHAQIKYLGTLDDTQKDQYLAHAAAVVNPSPMESMSMITLEAMASGVPVVVNGASDVLRYYAEETGTVFSYQSKEQFFQLVQRVLSTDWSAPAQQEALVHTKTWVSSHYTWARVTAIFARLI